MQSNTNIIIEGSNNKPISLDVFYNPTNKPKPIIIFIHGFKGFKDWGHFNAMAATFAEAECVFVKFNFSYNGTTIQNPSSFDDLEAFGQNNYIIELNDLGLVIDWVFKNEKLKNDIDKTNLALIGHSRGGGIAILKAQEDTRVAKLVTWAAVSDFINRNNSKTINSWKEKGVVYTLNSRTNQQMPLYAQFYEAILQNKERLNIIKSAKLLTIPFLIIHGTADEAVSFKDAEELHQACAHSELKLVGGAGHTFEVKHPFSGNVFPQNANNIINTTIAFVKQ